MSMMPLQSLLSALDEHMIAQQVENANDEVRARYPLTQNTVSDYREFERVLGDYVRYHMSACIMPGATMSDADARSYAKELLEQDYRRQGGSLTSAFHDAQQGYNGGLRGVLDRLANALKGEAVRRYTRDVFDRHVAPVDFDQKVELIRQLFAQFGAQLGSGVNLHQPERYAHDYEPLIQAFVDAMKRTASAFRRY